MPTPELLHARGGATERHTEGGKDGVAHVLVAGTEYGSPLAELVPRIVDPGAVDHRPLETILMPRPWTAVGSSSWATRRTR